MPKYVTSDGSRNRLIFQMRIPVDVREFFEGRTTIRKHLGNLPEAEASARALQMATHYKAIFAKFRAKTENSRPDCITSKTALLLTMDTDIARRFIATWKMQQSAQFVQQMDSLRDSPAESWDALADELKQERIDALEQMRRHNLAEFDKAIRMIESTLNIHFDGSHEAMDTLSRDFTSARVAFLKACLGVLSGDIPISSLFPDNTAQLPLVELWGDPAPRLAEHWRETVESSQCYVNPKTLDKYRNISADLGFVLSRRPVQAVTSADLDALKKLWKARGNIATTIKSKLDILKSLIRPFDQEKNLQPLFEMARAVAPVHRASRLPFTDDQLRKFIAVVFDSELLSQDDKMLLALMLLLSARLEEICQLRGEAFEATEKGWLVQIADHRQTGHGKTRLKNDASARRLPLHRDVFPGLDAWLAEHIKDGCYIFPDMRYDRYGKRGSAASKRLNRILRVIFPDDRRLVLQSTRNTASRIMRRADTDPRVRRRFLGHADVGIHDRYYDPGELLDDTDLEAGSVAIANYLRDIFRIEERSPVQA